MVLVDYAGGVDNLVAVLDLELVEEGVVPVNEWLDDVGPYLSCTEGAVLDLDVVEVVLLALGGPEDTEVLGEGGEQHHRLGVVVPQHRPEVVPGPGVRVLGDHELLHLAGIGS